MAKWMHVAVRTLDSVFHGRGDDGEPEWPPSPLRLFQALVAAAAVRWKDRRHLDHAVPALRWLEALPSPAIMASEGALTTAGYRLYVPNNAADIVAASWKRGDLNANISSHRTEKVVRPTHLSGEAVHYLYPLPPEGCPHEEVLKAAARSITHLGWGIDMVAADARVISQDEADRLPGHRWRVVDSGGVPLRVPKTGTLEDLIRKHEAFLNRLSDDGFRPVPPLTCFDVKRYHSPTVAGLPPVTRPCAAFQILTPDASRVRAFNAARGLRDVAAWVRNATAQVCAGWPFGSTAGFVHGHDPSDPQKPLKGDAANARFAYLPLPSIERRGDRGTHVGAIRRVLVTAPPGFRKQVDWVRLRLPAEHLVRPDRPDEPVAMLGVLPATDWVLRQYTGEAAIWSTVTPVLLPGYDDRNPAKSESLLLDAIRHAGYAPEAIVREELAWRSVGFRPGVDLVGRYERPENLKRFPAYHVRVTFRQPVRGPLVIGAGRYRGFGLFARDD